VKQHFLHKIEAQRCTREMDCESRGENNRTKNNKYYQPIHVELLVAQGLSETRPVFYGRLPTCVMCAGQSLLEIASLLCG
jgi:hypothetical protein